MRMKNLLIIMALLLTTVVTLTACGEVTSEQKVKWEQTTSQIETQQKALKDKIDEAKGYYDSLDADIKTKLFSDGFPTFNAPKSLTIPEKEKKFELAYDTLQENLEQLQELIKSVPTKESLEQKVEEVMPTIIGEREAKAKAEEELRIAKEKADAEARMMVEKTAALNKANSYLSTSHFSKAGLFNQLSSKAGSGFSEEAAQYAVDNVKVDWKEMALGKAGSYLRTSSFSKQGLYNQLTSKAGSKFLPDEAQYAIDNVKADWSEMALEKAKSYLRSSDMSIDRLRRQLQHEKFTDDEINYAINHLNN